MQPRRPVLAFLIMGMCVVLWPINANLQAQPPAVTLAKDGKASLPIYFANPPSAVVPAKKKAKQAQRPLDQAVADLRRVLKQMTAADFAFENRFPEGQPRAGLYLGTAKDFPWLDLPKDLGAEEFVLRTTKDSQIVLIAGGETGLSHAIYTFLEKLGCRWCFPGAAWEVVPELPTIQVALDERQKPDIALQRGLAMGFGMHSPAIQRDYADWKRRNRVLGTLQVVNSHSWPGINPQKDFAAHPEWFSLVKGERKPSKPCYAHPEVIARGVAQSLAFFEKNPGAQMVSTSAPDGAGFCECERCLALARVAKIERRGPSGLFGTNPEGQEVSVVSETIFHYANEVADAVAKKYPGKLVGMIAYSGYSHPPSFDLRPNVYVEVTKGYRETPLTLPEQISAFAEKAKHLGIYEYYDVEQWSWDQPGKARAAHLDYHAATIPYFFANKIHSIKGEMSNNWGPNGIGYYVLAKMMWDSTSDVRAAEEEFYEKGFGRAAVPIKRFYRRWESGQEVNPRTLGLAHRDLDEAVRFTADRPDCRARVDHIRMYLHFLHSSLFLRDFTLLVWGEGLKRENLDKLIKRHGEAELKKRVQRLGDDVQRLMDTHMVHSFAYNNYLKSVGKLLGCETSKWQKPGAIPSAAEIDAQFALDMKEYDIAILKDVDARLFGRDLVPLKETRPDLVKAEERKIVCEGFSKGSLFVQAKKGETVAITFVPFESKKESTCDVSFVSFTAFAKDRADLDGERLFAKKLDGVLRFEATRTGCYQIHWTEASIAALSHPAVVRGNKETSLRGATLYFFVPKETRSFLLKPHLGQPAFRIHDGLGKIVLDYDAKKAKGGLPAELIVNVPKGSDDGIWSIAGPRDKLGRAFVEFIGVPNYLSLLPEQMLIPREFARQGAPTK